MATIIVSDLHLTTWFDRRKYRYLEDLFAGADRIILNGDFWDGFLVTFDKFVHSSWKNLFPLLRSKETIYIYGNHDSRNLSDGKVSLFSKVQAERIQLNIGRRFMHIEHGHKIVPALNERYPFIPVNRALFFIVSIIFVNMPLFLFGPGIYRRSNRYRNKIMKNWARRLLSDDYYLVCGHSHLAEINHEDRFLNSGFIRQGYAQYLKIDNEEIKLVTERYD